MAEPLISVCIPAYNHARYVEATVRSVVGQDWPRMELLVVDDGSKDDTWAVLQRLKPECERRFERVEMLTRENRGSCRTQLQLVGMARGDFIAIIASDDQYMPGAFSAMMRAMADDPGVGVVVGQNEFIDSDGKRCFWDAGHNLVYDSSSARYRTFNEFLAEHTGVGGDDAGFGRYEDLIRANHVPNGYLIRKSALDKVTPFNPEAPLEDLWLHLQLSKVSRYRMIPESTFRYRWHSANTVRQLDRMLELGYRTLKCEERNARAMAGTDWARRFAGASSEKRTLCAIGPLSIVKKVTLEEKRWTLNALGHELTLKRRPRKMSVCGHKVILKLDDFMGVSWQVRLMDAICRSLDVKVTWGIVGQYVEKWSKSQIDWISARAAGGMYMFWNHGWTHEMDEFKSLTANEARIHLEKTQQSVRQRLGIAMDTFGAPCNALNADTCAAVEAIPEIRYWYYGDEKFSRRNFVRTANMEKSVGVPSFRHFVESYLAAPKTGDALVLQAHPNVWGLARFVEFVRIARFLKREGWQFAFPSEV